MLRVWWLFSLETLAKVSKHAELWPLALPVMLMSRGKRCWRLRIVAETGKASHTDGHYGLRAGNSCIAGRLRREIPHGNVYRLLTSSG
jgi:hypothetical protein